jgi:predicted transglutaminase-like protease
MGVVNWFYFLLCAHRYRYKVSTVLIPLWSERAEKRRWVPVPAVVLPAWCIIIKHNIWILFE